MRFRIAVVAVVLVAAAGCGKSDKTTAAAPRTTAATAAVGTVPPSAPGTTSGPTTTTAASQSGLSGTWNGTWQNTTPDSSSGTFRIQWTQAGSALTGTISITGTPCLTGGSISGALNGSSLSFGVVTGQVQVSYTGTLSGAGALSGTYTTSCGNAQGSWRATKA